MDTQRQRLLALLNERGGQGVYVYEIMQPRPDGLGIAQYNARIKELRESGYTIINTKPGHFVLQASVVSTPDDYKSIEEKLEKLREEWKECKRKNDIGRMKLIEMRAKLLSSYKDDFVEMVQEALL
jgi:hypothetical protein